MTFSEALGELAAHGATRFGKMIRNELEKNPDLFNGVFTPTPDKDPPHFQTKGPRGGVWYLRPFHNDKTSIQFGKDP